MISSLSRKYARTLLIVSAVSAFIGCNKFDAQVTKPADVPQTKKGNIVATETTDNTQKNVISIRIAPVGLESLSGSIQFNGIPIRSGRLIAHNSKGFIPSVGVIVDGRYEIHNLPQGFCTLMVVLDPNGEMPLPLPPLPPEMPPMPHMPHMHKHRFPQSPLHHLQLLKQFEIPETEDVEIYQLLHAHYGNTGSPLNIHVHQGVNQFDIMLGLPEIE